MIKYSVKWTLSPAAKAVETARLLKIMPDLTLEEAVRMASEKHRSHRFKQDAMDHANRLKADPEACESLTIRDIETGDYIEIWCREGVASDDCLKNSPKA